MTIPAFTILRNGVPSASVAYVPHVQKGCAPRTIITLARHATRADVSEILRELATQETAHVVIEGKGELADVYPDDDDATRWILFVDGKGIRTLDRDATVDALFALFALI